MLLLLLFLLLMMLLLILLLMLLRMLLLIIVFPVVYPDCPAVPGVGEEERWRRGLERRGFFAPNNLEKIVGWKSQQTNFGSGCCAQRPRRC